MSFSEMFNNNNVYNYRPFFTDITTTPPNYSKHLLDHHQSPPDSNFFNLQLPSSPSFNPCSFDDLFPNQNSHFLLQQQEQQQQQQKAMENITTIFNFSANDKDLDDEVNKIKNVVQDEQQTVVTKKRGSKKDRHSKINTAKGPRDRRMRLSLKVAREFFDLQDKLCFDKASKTVEWLLLEARSAILKLSGGGTSTASSTSECEVVSGIEDETVPLKEDNNVSKGKTKADGKKEKAGKACPRKSAFNRQAKESREKARAKARERTRMKNDESRRRELEEAKTNGSEFNQLCWFQESTSTQSHPNCTSEVEAPVTSPIGTTSEISITDESWAAIGKWSPIPSLTHFYTSGFPQELNHQMTDFQITSLCKQIWE